MSAPIKAWATKIDEDQPAIRGQRGPLARPTLACSGGKGLASVPPFRIGRIVVQLKIIAVDL
jgi:hypothetical protein